MSQIIISEEQLEQLSRAELVALVKLLLAETEREFSIEQLKAGVAELEAQASSGPPPATSRNSSPPPSRDQKTNAGEQQGDSLLSPKRVGAKPGHQAVTRPLVEEPGRT
jgi:DNA invertase Pin-like site-specific DNA recombinase